MSNRVAFATLGPASKAIMDREIADWIETIREKNSERLDWLSQFNAHKVALEEDAKDHLREYAEYASAQRNAKGLQPFDWEKETVDRIRTVIRVGYRAFPRDKPVDDLESQSELEKKWWPGFPTTKITYGRTIEQILTTPIPGFRLENERTRAWIRHDEKRRKTNQRMHTARNAARLIDIYERWFGKSDA
ncbi:MAG: hypothetical protein [Bacteriophage sp.]|nr:MAG: hypothetical protein [Bacteriophage sp.]